LVFPVYSVVVEAQFGWLFAFGRTGKRNSDRNCKIGEDMGIYEDIAAVVGDTHRMNKEKV